MPTLGPKSLEQFNPGDVAAMAWLASHTLIAEKELFIAQAEKLEIVLVAVKKQSQAFNKQPAKMHLPINKMAQAPLCCRFELFKHSLQRTTT